MQPQDVDPPDRRFICAKCHDPKVATPAMDDQAEAAGCPSDVCDGCFDGIRICTNCEEEPAEHVTHDPWGRVHEELCDSCADRAYESYCTDYGAPSASERLEMDHCAKRETR